MQALVVYAHPEPTSFSAALKDEAVRTLAAKGFGVTVSDLYAEGFNPVAGRHDFTTVANDARFHYQAEQQHAALHGGFASDLAREQARLDAANLVVFVFPLWWGGVPAILKGWFDRVCAYGVAYADGKRFDSGFYRGRRAMFAITTGGTPERFSASGAYGELQHVLHGVRRCMLEYLGLEVLPPFVAYAAPRVTSEARERYLSDWSARIAAAVDDASWAAGQADAAQRLQVARRAATGAADWTRAR
jgi:NAD(P)H dehydrogenase (quinone)